ncbi:thiamine pyrophosphokinase [Coemansia sp. RSA 1722]|nr:thiamine pyrophosphokinase [Coemansia sp. RSA 486]KAJ2231341.1 thiamine pyrophosphokinase [Coemansia sp. RSA 485]KAJ2602798.1 thiamine pyrophosphokinase [Coemansia sp. RSA 1721]KAJ2606740.1 thiamine pyrophosphokinase [Coemansia sp. RSA 1722]KAJ2639864.1 thiamine pyrophosphokinase [Coemansia sp. RSA 1286]
MSQTSFDSTGAEPTMHLGSYLLYPQAGTDSAASWPEDKEIALFILNQPIPHADTAFLHIWDRANYRLCVDGGANRLHTLSHSLDKAGAFTPDVIVGDLDSLEDSTREHYAQRGAIIHRYDDQNSTDFMKGLMYLDTVLRAGKDPRDCVVIVFGGLSGRLDHVLHTLKVLFNNKERQILVVSDENLTFAVPAGKNTVMVNKQIDGPTCGILPLAGETVLTTRGLRWNLSGHKSSFEGLMSTSNIVDSPESVYIETTLPVAWTCEFNPLV